jgi:CRP-like cAMP-binding protein
MKSVINSLFLGYFLVMRKGDEADCMYILYHGEVNVYAGDEDRVTVVLHEN